MWLKKRILNMRDQSFSTLDEFLLNHWEKCEAGFLHYVNKDKKPRDKDFENWERLFNEYVERYDLSDDFKEYLELKTFITELRLQYILTGNRALKTQINIKEIDLARKDPSRIKGMNIDDCLVYLSKWMGGKFIRKNEITIVEFKSLLKQYERSSKKE